MPRRRDVLQSALAGALLAPWPARVLAADRGRRIDYRGLAVPGLPDQRLTIWLPPGYDAGSTPHRVLYMHDAQNLFDPALSNFNKVWAADAAMLGHAAASGEDAWIIVGIWSPGPDRYRQYLPAPAYAGASPRLKAAMDEYAGGPIVSRGYIDWIAGALKEWVDRSFRTRPARADTAIAGSSMGGLISLYAFLEHRHVFGRAGCLSTHWPGVAPAKVGGVDAEILGLWTAMIKAGLGAPDGRKLWFDHGDATLDAFYPPYQRAIDTAMAETGWQRGEHWESRFYPGAEHEENAWASRLPEVFGWLLG